MHPRDAVCGARDASPMGGYTRSVAITAGRVACAVDPSSSSSSVTPSAMRDARCAVRRRRRRRRRSVDSTGDAHVTPTRAHRASSTHRTVAPHLGGFFFGVARIGVRISRVRHSLTRSVCTRDDDDDDDERKQPTNHRTHSPRCDHGCTTSTRRAG